MIGKKSIWVWGRWESKRPTEMQALHDLLHGWVPTLNGASVDDMRQLPPHAPTPLNWNPTTKPHPQAIGRKCSSCAKRKPLTHDFWDRDKRCQHGYKTICKACRRRYQRKR